MIIPMTSAITTRAAHIAALRAASRAHARSKERHTATIVARRECVEEAHRAGLTYHEIAKALGMTQSAAYQLLHPLESGWRRAKRIASEDGAK